MIFHFILFYFLIHNIFSYRLLHGIDYDYFYRTDNTINNLIEEFSG